MKLREAIPRFQSYMRVFDWLLGSASLAYGLYAHNWFWIVSGFIGFGLAWYNPGACIGRRLSMIRPARPGAVPPPKR